jgi:hypothetical protein
MMKFVIASEAIDPSLRAKRSNPGATKKELDRFVGFASSQ